MTFLVDMNLLPKWCAAFENKGWGGIHWTQVGRPDAPDWEIMQSAAAEGRIVLTHDLDFGAILASTQAKGPSVVQMRTQDVRPRTMAPKLVPILRQHEPQLTSGALLVVDERRSRIRLLPLARNQTHGPDS